jgi:predicted transcriptional regulator
MNLLQTSVNLEENDNLHISRLILLLGVFSDKERQGTIDGLTKLAKLDFLLRYPAFLERALEAKDVPIARLQIKTYERKNVESTMVRYRYGPWDFRYRRFINILIAKGLATISIEGRTTNIGLTDEGLKIYSKLSEESEFEDLVFRAKLLKRHFNKTGTHLKNFVYRTFPEISSLRLGAEIEYEY